MGKDKARGTHGWVLATTAAAVWTAALLSPAAGAMDPNQVLVVYNSQNADSLSVYNYYVSKRPGVLGFDLNDASLSAGNITRADYAGKIRDPIRSYLSANSLSEQVVTMTLTKGLPHRIYDMNSSTAGDTPSSAGSLWQNGNATFASVDSELTLLWQDLSAGESGGTMDSYADNHIVNPYHAQSGSITAHSRSQVTSSVNYWSTSNVLWQWGPLGTSDSDAGRMYLTTRLDGNSVAAVEGMIDRAQEVYYHREQHRIILDENATGDLDDGAIFTNKSADPGYQGDDYDDAYATLSPQYDATTLEETSAFLIGENGTVSDTNATPTSGQLAALGSYGGNHSGASQAGYLDTWIGQIADGAIMNTLESYNAKQFGGLSGFGDQGQLSEWVDNGGTFGVGNVWEPFSFSVADNEFLLENFIYNGLTWAEAAWSSAPWLSWQQLVIGDPLATAQAPLPGDADLDGDVDLTDFNIIRYNWGTGDTWMTGDFNGDGTVDLTDFNDVRYHWGGSSAPPTMSQVPEPATITLLLTGLAGLAMSRRRTA